MLKRCSTRRLGAWLVLAATGCATPTRVVGPREFAIRPLAARADTPPATDRALTAFFSRALQIAQQRQAILRADYDPSEELSLICVGFADAALAERLLAPLRSAAALRVSEEHCLADDQTARLRASAEHTTP